MILTAPLTLIKYELIACTKDSGNRKKRKVWNIETPILRICVCFRSILSAVLKPNVSRKTHA